MPISPALDIARRALLAQQTALSVTGHNIANVNTPGYTRQVPDFESEPGGPVGGNVTVGRGVRLDGVVQVVDLLLARRRLAAETGQGETTVRRDQLRDLSGIVNDLKEPSLTGMVDAFFDAADALALNPGGSAERQTLLGRASGLASEFNRRAGGLSALQRALDDRVLGLRDEVNASLQEIADLNRVISATEIVGGRANDLRDRRQSALNDLASKIGITAIEDARGAVTVASTAGPVLVAGGDVVHRIATQAGAAGLDSGSLHDVGLEDTIGGFLAVPAVFGSGAAAALLQVRDQSLVTAATNLDNAAGALRDAVNAIQTDPAARDLNGAATTTAPFFSGTNAATLQVALTDPRRIAAALSTNPGDNTNALRLADLRTSAAQTVAPTSAAALALGTSTIGQFLAAELGRVGTEAAEAETEATGAELLATTLEEQRATLSGVNLNEELTDLLKYQHAFQAAAQILNVTNRMLDELMQVA